MGIVLGYRVYSSCRAPRSDPPPAVKLETAILILLLGGSQARDAPRTRIPEVSGVLLRKRVVGQIERGRT